MLLLEMCEDARIENDLSLVEYNGRIGEKGSGNLVVGFVECCFRWSGSNVRIGNRTDDDR